MSNMYILPPVVFAFVPGMATVVSKRTAPSLPSPSIENAPVESIAAAKMPTAVHNNVRFLRIASLPGFFEPLLAARGHHSPFLDGASTRGLRRRKYSGIAMRAAELGTALFDIGSVVCCYCPATALGAGVRCWPKADNQSGSATSVRAAGPDDHQRGADRRE